MIGVSFDTLPVPVASGVVLNIHAINASSRSLLMWNLTTGTLSLKVEGSVDGSTWTTLVTTFSLGPYGGGSDLRVEKITSNQILRIVGSGGGASRDLMVALIDPQGDTGHTWQSPVI